jgi:hypothetical protein
MSIMTSTAGQRLHADLDAALEHAAQEAGEPSLQWTEASR